MSADRIDLNDLGEAAFIATGGLYPALASGVSTKRW
jgi:hypothetical protein